jgi:beta-glucosidase
MLSGSAIAMPWAKENIPAILQAWYGGQSGGTAIADVLFGDCNPGGRLPLTFYESVDDLPQFTDYNMDNRTYRYFKGKPLFPFGFGLSYTEFGYSNLQMPSRLPAKNPVHISVDVSNTGKMKGDEVVQLYLSHPDYSGKHPIRALNGFKRISLEPGEKKTVSFTLSPEQFELVDEHGAPVTPSGRIGVSVGGKQPGFTGSLDAATTQVVEGVIRT